MPLISLTRLRIRSVRYLPGFAFHTSRSLRQVKKARGFLGGSVLADRRWTFWTLTSWDSHESMRGYMVSGSHQAAMPHLMQWCDEASVTHWDEPGNDLPGWEEAVRRMRESGRVSKLRFPSADHAALSFPSPRLTGGGLIRPAKVSPLAGPA